MEIEYGKQGPITDYVCTINNQNIGVSVTRCMNKEGEYSTNDAKVLIKKKFDGRYILYNGL
jgi:hypothetical protein